MDQGLRHLWPPCLHCLPHKAHPLSAACGQQTWREHTRSMEHSAVRKYPRVRELQNQQSAVSRAELSCFNLGTWGSLQTTKTKTSVPTLQSPAASPGQTKQGLSPHQSLEKTHRKKGPMGDSWLKLGTPCLLIPSKDRCPPSMVITSGHTEGCLSCPSRAQLGSEAPYELKILYC